MPFSFDLIIFDCDGTLVDSEYLNNLSCSQILTEAGLPQYTLDYAYANFVGLNQAKIFEKIERDNGITLPPDMTERFIARVRAGMAEHLRSAPGSVELIRALTSSIKLCVASNGERPNVESALEAAGITALLPAGTIYTAADVVNPKPAPDLFLHAARRAGAAPNRCAVIEDSVAGTQAGVAAGMTVFGYVGLAHDPDNQKRLLEEAGAVRVIDDLGDLLLFVNEGLSPVATF